MWYYTSSFLFSINFIINILVCFIDTYIIEYSINNVYEESDAEEPCLICLETFCGK